MSDVATEPDVAPAVTEADQPARRLRLPEWGAATIGSFLLAIAMTWLIPPYAADLASGGVKPATIGNPATTIAGDGGDTAAQAWLVAWDGHALKHGLSGWWESNAFYPAKYGLALNDTLFGYVPAGLIGHGMTAALLRYNILFVFAFGLAFLGGYALVRQLGAGRVAAAVAGAALAYTPWRYGHIGHLNILSTGGITLAFAMLARGHGWSLARGYLRERVRPGWAIAGWVVAAWQVSLGFGVGLVFVYMLALTFLCAGVGWLVRGRPPLPGRLILGDLGGGLFFTAVTGYFAYAYQHIRELYPDVLRSWEYTGAFSPTLRGLLVAPGPTLLWGKMHEPGRMALGVADNEKALLCGYALYLLAFGGMFLSIWSMRQRLLMLAGTVVGVLFALGTNGPTYRLLYLYVPGFDGSRTPGRLILWPTILLAVLAAGFVAGLARAARNATLPEWRRPAALVVTVPLLVAVLAEGLPDLAHVRIAPRPAAMAAAPAPFVVLPSDDGFDSTTMIWSTEGFPKMVNGVASYNPPDRQQVRDTMQTFPSAQSLDLLRQHGIRSVVVVRDRVVGTPFELALGAQGVPGLTRRDIGPDVLFTLD
ncbi:hypothetical protein GCM10010172_63510 [Paractinoplanes ferrugineus]|uniref:Glycosyltransferase RgtA/B/C/D-like domain-containing protein n=1 Tax=Paractinoplanes ferrugineus TaxID=113564 RepID=A0A919MQL8_9ACTN|nr:hypothetical protein [Actinoplanes ferrugineus]GIE16457.1 hypothetical protein Afe05nite_82970 [Actinoplanes ferrugineus]